MFMSSWDQLAKKHPRLSQWIDMGMDEADEAEDASSKDDSDGDNKAGWEDIEDNDTLAADWEGTQKKSKKKNGFSAIVR
jgi:hypothetical protein